MNRPLISVVMITYAHEHFIEEAILGVLAQECSYPIEFIVANDNSPDNTDTLVKNILATHPRASIIRYTCHRENKGMAGNFEWALRKARGTYIALCEGDDYWTDPLKLQKQGDFLEANETFAICFHKVLISKGGALLDDYITNVPAAITGQEDLLDRGNYIHTPSVMIRRRCINFPIWFATVMPADFALYIIATNREEKIYCLDAVMAHYRVHAGGIWSGALKNTHTQKVALTLYNCYRHASKKDKVRQAVKDLAYTVRLLGFRNIRRFDYYRIIWRELLQHRFSAKEMVSLFTPGIRKAVGGTINEPEERS